MLLLGGSLVDRRAALGVPFDSSLIVSTSKSGGVPLSSGTLIVMSSISLYESNDVDTEPVLNEVLGVWKPVEGRVFEEAIEPVLAVLNERMSFVPPYF